MFETTEFRTAHLLRESRPTRWGHGIAGRRTPRLTPRQVEVLGLLCHGKSNKAIADALGISPTTVKVHLSAILRALGVTNRTEAVLVMRPQEDAVAR